MVKILGDFFYSKNINVLDLVTTRENEKYTMIFQVDLTHLDSMEEFRGDLAALGSKEKLNLVLQHNDIFMATNEVGTQLETITAE
jgi:predicted amino acid-binding ACT domain protein